MCNKRLVPLFPPLSNVVAKVSDGPVCSALPNRLHERDCGVATAYHLAAAGPLPRCQRQPVLAFVRPICSVVHWVRSHPFKTKLCTNTVVLCNSCNSMTRQCLVHNILWRVSAVAVISQLAWCYALCVKKNFGRGEITVRLAFIFSECLATPRRMQAVNKLCKRQAGLPTTD